MRLRRILKKKTMDYLKVSEEDLNRAEDLRIQQENEKKIRDTNLKDIDNQNNEEEGEKTL